MLTVFFVLGGLIGNYLFYRWVKRLEQQIQTRSQEIDNLEDIVRSFEGDIKTLENEVKILASDCEEFNKRLDLYNMDKHSLLDGFWPLIEKLNKRIDEIQSEREKLAFTWSNDTADNIYKRLAEIEEQQEKLGANLLRIDETLREIAAWQKKAADRIIEIEARPKRRK